MTVNIYNLYDYIPANIFSKITNRQIIVYLICLLIILFVAKTTNKFSYVFILSCLYIVFIYFSQLISNTNQNIKTQENKNHIEYLEIDSQFIANDKELVKILYGARFIKERSPDKYSKMLEYINYFLILYESLKQNKTNIFLESSNMLKSQQLTKIDRSLLINDLRDQLEKIMNHIQTLIYNMPHHKQYLDNYYYFSQLIRSHLSEYYNKILSETDIEDHTSKYQLIRSSENKYDFIN